MLKRSAGTLDAMSDGLESSSQSFDGEEDEPGNLHPLPMMAIGSGAIVLLKLSG